MTRNLAKNLFSDSPNKLSFSGLTLTMKLYQCMMFPPKALNIQGLRPPSGSREEAAADVRAENEPMCLCF